MIRSVMQQPTIVFLDVESQDMELVTGRFPQAACFTEHLKEDALVDACKDAEIVSAFNITRFPREILEKLPKLKLLSTRSVGYDHIDLAYCAERGIVVTNVPDYGAHVIAEHAFALLLSAVRHIPEGHQRVLQRKFEYRGIRGIALRGKTMGVIGTGRIGQKTVEIAHGFGMKILAHDVHPVPELQEKYGVTYVELPQLLAESDVISLHAPLIPETQYMINEKTLNQMKDGVILINTARGILIDSSDLLVALDDRKVHYALLDVFENETNIEKDAELIRHPRVISTPHVAFYADQSVMNMLEDSFKSIEQWMNGQKPEHAVAVPKAA